MGEMPISDKVVEDIMVGTLVSFPREQLVKIIFIKKRAPTITSETVCKLF